MKLGSFFVALAAADYRKEILEQCSSQVGSSSFLHFDGETEVQKVAVTIPPEKKNDYFGMEALMHHSSYKRPTRCGAKQGCFFFTNSCGELKEHKST